jgi:hypothetical protein
MQLGLHRRRAHGIEGRDAGKKRDRAPRRSPAGGKRAPSLKADLRRTFRLAGTVVGVFDPYCGSILMDRTEHLADAIARLAQDDPRIARWLSAIGRAGPYGALMVAAAEVAVPIAAHHGLMAPEIAALFGAPPIPSPAPAPEPPAFTPEGGGEGEGEAA